MELDEIEEIFEDGKEDYLGFLEEFLGFQSISAEEEHNGDCDSCAEWLAEKLQEFGLEAELLETSGKTVVVGRFTGDADKPHVLLYGHYDVQPVEPLSQWNTDPFKPTWRDNRVYARGAEDDKGQISFTLQAIAELIAADRLRCSLTILLEGEEESGSHSLFEALPEWEDWLQTDILMVADTQMPSLECPSITMGLRGILSFEIGLYGLKHDLHSGVHGGVVLNPATELIRLIASLYNDDGSIAVEGFYDGVEEPTNEVRNALLDVPFSQNDYRDLVGVLPTGGEKSYPPVFRRSIRPTIDVNGIEAGYNGSNIKTIIPASASAKLSARLVGEQDPEDIYRALQYHFLRLKPEALDFYIKKISRGASALTCDEASQVTEDARGVLRDIFDKEPLSIWEGGSVPVVAELARISGAQPLLVGFGLDEDAIHAPNESFSIEQFKAGFMYTMQILDKFSE